MPVARVARDAKHLAGLRLIPASLAVVPGSSDLGCSLHQRGIGPQST